MNPADCKQLRKAVGETQHGLGGRASVPAWRIAHFEAGLIELTEGEIERLKAAIAVIARENAARVAAAISA